MRQLHTFFPGVSFTYEAERPIEMEAVKLSLLLRLWLYFFGWEVPYPRYCGLVESPTGWAIQFYFVSGPTVQWVRATSYGRTAGLDATFERLRKATGWVTYYPP